jgi:hypothetical protein
MALPTSISISDRLNPLRVAAMVTVSTNDLPSSPDLHTPSGESHLAGTSVKQVRADLRRAS